MMLWIVSKITSPFVIFEELDRLTIERLELARKTFQLNCLFSCFGCSDDDLCLTAGKRHARLPLRTPRDSGT